MDADACHINFERYFPFQQIRTEQSAAIAFALSAFQGGKKFVILEMGTGCGKSATGITIARALADESDGHSAYVLTTQKMLQDQYVSDFGMKSGRALLTSIKSSSNYACGAHGQSQSCAESRRIFGSSKLAAAAAKTNKFASCKTDCPYTNEKKAFLQSSIGVTNFPYFLAETMYAGQLTARDILIVDECHNVEAELGRFIEVSFSERFGRDVLGCAAPRTSEQSAIHKWIDGPYKRALLGFIAKNERDIEDALSCSQDQQAQLAELGKRMEMLDKHLCKVNRFLSDYDGSDGWIMNVTHAPGGVRRFEFKPVDVSRYSHDSLFRFGEKVLMMSATIVDVDVFCQSLGIPKEQVAFARFPSPFPVENRPVHFLPIGSMSKSKIDESLPKMVEAIKFILSQHPREKGIVHCVNYRIAKFICDNLADPRLLLHDQTNRDATIEEHKRAPGPTVLISPSMTEGVDLAGDLSRFQIIVKVPFPYLGDELVRRRMNLNPSWYSYQTARAIMQALGRSIRSTDDHAVSYILDADWERFFGANSHMFPREFKDALN